VKSSRVGACSGETPVEGYHENQRITDYLAFQTRRRRLPGLSITCVAAATLRWLRLRGGELS